MNFSDFILEKSDRETQTEYKNFFELIKQEGRITYSKTPIKKDNRSPNSYTIRADLGNDPIKYFETMGKSLPRKLTVEPSTVAISGTYDTFKVTYDKKTFYIVNSNASRGSSTTYFKTKDLTPDIIGLGGKTVAKTDLKKYVTAWLLTSRFDKTAVSKLIKIVNACYDSDKSEVEIPNLNFNQKDLKTISKDFGEILAGFWLINNQKFTKINFPEGSNYPLVDLFAIKGTQKRPISVKSGGGSNTPITNILDNILELDPSTLTQKEQKLIDALKLIGTQSLAEGPLKSAAKLRTPGYKAVSKVTGPITETTALQNFIANMSEEEMKEKFADLFKLSTPSDKSFSVLINTPPETKVGLILGPLTADLVKELNDEDNKKTLTGLVQKVDVQQLNVDVYNSKVVFKMKAFKDSTFKFGWGGGATTYKRVRVGFKLS